MKIANAIFFTGIPRNQNWQTKLKTDFLTRFQQRLNLTQKAEKIKLASWGGPLGKIDLAAGSRSGDGRGLLLDVIPSALNVALSGMGLPNAQT